MTERQVMSASALGSVGFGIAAAAPVASAIGLAGEPTLVPAARRGDVAFHRRAIR